MAAIYKVQSLNSKVKVDTAEKITKRLMLSQYLDSVNLHDYLACFFAELETLNQEVQKVYFGRFLEYATGAQLDALGEIIDQPRSVQVPLAYFGFQGAPAVLGFAPESDPTHGGIFRSENDVKNPTSSIPLNDLLYRRLLLTKGHVLSSETCDINTAYSAFATILGKIPSRFKLELRDWDATLDLPMAEVTETEQLLCQYVGNWVVPCGTSFLVSRS